MFRSSAEGPRTSTSSSSTTHTNDYPHGLVSAVSPAECGRSWEGPDVAGREGAARRRQAGAGCGGTCHTLWAGEAIPGELARSRERRRCTTQGLRFGGGKEIRARRQALAWHWTGIDPMDSFLHPCRGVQSPSLLARSAGLHCKPPGRAVSLAVGQVLGYRRQADQGTGSFTDPAGHGLRARMTGCREIMPVLLPAHHLLLGACCHFSALLVTFREGHSRRGCGRRSGIYRSAPS